MKIDSGNTPLGSPPALDARGRRVAVVAARFNDRIVSQLLDGVRAAWQRHGGAADELVLHRVPGAFELPLACRQIALTGRYAAVVALGCVVRGDTPHFDYVAGQCARGLMDAGLGTGVPVIFGVLTVETQGQAEERADPARMDKGGEALAAALEMAQLLAGLRA